MATIEVFYHSAEDFKRAYAFQGDQVGDGSWLAHMMDERAEQWIEDEAEELEGWYWWSCEPGCLPDNEEPHGPFETEEEAREDAGIDDEEEDPMILSVGEDALLTVLSEDRPMTFAQIYTASGLGPQDVEGWLYRLHSIGAVNLAREGWVKTAGLHFEGSEMRLIVPS